MRRILCIFLALTACVSLSAQQRGDKSVTLYVGATFSSVPSAGFDIMGQFDYFFLDNTRASLSVGLPFSSTVIGKLGADNLKENTVGVYFSPNVAYYVKLGDNFYYTPEIGFGYELGSYRQRAASTTYVNGRYNGIYAYMYPFYFEVRVNARMAIGIALGELYFENYKYRDGSNQIVDTSKSVSFTLNSGALCWRYYL